MAGYIMDDQADGIVRHHVPFPNDALYTEAERAAVSAGLIKSELASRGADMPHERYVVDLALAAYWAGRRVDRLGGEE